MKEIQSAGGPLIGLDRDDLHLWTGVFGKGFIGEASPFRNDYEAAGYLTDGRAYPPCNIAGFTGIAAHGFLITVPDYTAIIDFDKDSIYIAQIQYCDHDWNFHRLELGYFSNAQFDRTKDVFFSCKSCTYVLFDAAYEGRNVGDDCLTFDLEAGDYVVSAAKYEPDERTGLILCKISREIGTVPRSQIFQRERAAVARPGS